MPLQDLTPELRTRLSAVERTVGWFVTLATIILVAGFAFYIYRSAETKGWFITKINYATSINDASGLTVGDPVKLMGFTIGEIERIDLNEPLKKYGVTVFFWIRDPYPGYIWLDSRVRENQDFLGHSSLEILKGHTGAATAWQDKANNTWMVLRSLEAYSTYKDLTLTNHMDSLQASNVLKGIIESNKPAYYMALGQGKFNKPPDEKVHNYVYIATLDTPSLSDRLNAVANTVEGALPNILNLTNQLAGVLTNAAAAVARLDRTLAELHTTVTNVNTITGNLTNGEGSLGAWLIPPHLSDSLHETLSNASATLSAAHDTLDNADTNLVGIATNLDETLAHLSDLTSNLAWQVQGNTNLVGSVAKIIVDTDSLVQGLKHHWLLRSAFKKKPEKADKTRSP